VHRDIKPANMMLTSDGQGKIADFGIARIESSSMTQAGTVLGTPAYMSPEQFMGQVVDSRTDIYSSGVMLYQLLTGERPFEGGMSAIMHKALNTDPPLPSQISVTCPPAFDAVVRKAMAKRPEARFQSAAEFLEALQAAVAGKPIPGMPVAEEADEEATMVAPSQRRAPPPTASATAARPPAASASPAAAVPATAPVRRSAMPMIAAAVVVVLALAGGGAWFFLLRGNPASAPVPAPTAQNNPPNAPQVATNTTPASPSPSPSPSIAPAPQPTPTPAAAQPPSTPAPTQPTPAPPPNNPPQQLASAGVDTIRQQITDLSLKQPCLLVDGTVRPNGDVTLTGLGGQSEAAAFRQALDSITNPGAVDWRVGAVDSGFCPALSTLQPIDPMFGTAGSHLALALAEGKTRLRDGERILPRLVMPDFRGRLVVDYVAHDGTLLHLYPQLADPSQHMTADVPRTFQPGEAVDLGDPRAGHPAWEVGPPYGTDMIIAIASSQPLFDRARPGNVEQAATYLRDLQQAVDAARQRGAKLVGNAITVDTLPKQ